MRVLCDFLKWQQEKRINGVKRLKLHQMPCCSLSHLSILMGVNLQKLSLTMCTLDEPPKAFVAVLVRELESGRSNLTSLCITGFGTNAPSEEDAILLRRAVESGKTPLRFFHWDYGNNYLNPDLSKDLEERANMKMALTRGAQARKARIVGVVRAVSVWLSPAWRRAAAVVFHPKRLRAQGAFEEINA